MRKTLTPPKITHTVLSKIQISDPNNYRLSINTMRNNNNKISTMWLSGRQTSDKQTSQYLFRIPPARGRSNTPAVT